MRIGLYGGMANNMYVFAKELALHGEDLCFIRDRKDFFPMSQPIWEDIPFSMNYDEIDQAKNWSWDQWRDFEKKMNWKEPEWLSDPLRSQVRRVSIQATRQGIINKYFLKWYVNEPHRRAVLHQMRACDALLVCGVEEAILANVSGKPFVVLPFGGDLMIASGLLKPPLRNIRTRIIHELLTSELIYAYSKAMFIGIHEPTGYCNDYFGAENFIKKQRVEFLAMPIPIRKRLGKEQRRKMLNQLLVDQGCNVTSTEFVGFVPSRIDYIWKGHDRLLQALNALHQEGNGRNLHLIFSGWGENYNKARQFVADFGLSANVTFLPCALSKPLLYQFYSSSDFVVDQFIVGMTGTSSLDAFSCGAPVIMWLNDRYERPWGAPPILQARTTDEITAMLLSISQGEIDLEVAGNRLQQYMDRMHNPKTVVRDLIAKFRERGAQRS